MNEKKIKENKMYFICDNEYIYFPFSSINCTYNNIKKYGNQLICLNKNVKEVIRNE